MKVCLHCFIDLVLKTYTKSVCVGSDRLNHAAALFKTINGIEPCVLHSSKVAFFTQDEQVVHKQTQQVPLLDAQSGKVTPFVRIQKIPELI